MAALVGLATLVVVLGSYMIYGATLDKRTETMQGLAATIQSKQDALIKSETVTAVSMLEALDAKVASGELTKAKAMKLGADLLRELRYGADKQGYFFADTKAGVNVVLYGNKAVEGKDRLNDTVKDIPYVKTIIANGQKAGGGYTDYWYPRLEGKEPVQKRAYSLYFTPFDWIVGTGYYQDDLKKEIVDEADAKGW